MMLFRHRAQWFDSRLVYCPKYNNCLGIQQKYKLIVVIRPPKEVHTSAKMASLSLTSTASCQKGPTCHAWQIGPF